VYIFKFLIPVHLSCLHEYPLTEAGKAPFYIYFSPVIFILLFAIIYRTWKSKKYITFGLLFFLFTIFPVLQFLPVGQAIVAERYTYIPYIGISVLAVLLFFEISKRIQRKNLRNLFSYLFAGILLVFMYSSWERSKIWKNSESLWTDVMVKYPESISAYVNRGYIYNQYDRYEEAIRDCNAGMKLDSNNYKLYINRAISYRKMKKYDLAVADLGRAIVKQPNHYDSYLERGIIYTDLMAKYDSGIHDFKKFLLHKPRHPKGTFNLAVAYFKKGEYDSAMVYCRKSIKLSPRMATPYYVIAVISADQQNFKQAYEAGMKARSLGFSVKEEELTTWKNRAAMQQASE
ncbi:MAG: tetratricopeptide repeat protein, partial [Bacteroidia bacterium]|nr:tetratricopeptide repeat protein [Bacteroidia bacterium]